MTHAYTIHTPSCGLEFCLGLLAVTVAKAVQLTKMEKQYK